MAQQQPQRDQQPTPPQQGAFQPLQQGDFVSLQHAPFFKGLLKPFKGPFKGKGELDQLAEQCRSLEADLNALAQERVLAQAQRYPFTLLPIRLTHQVTSAGTVFLRWQKVGTRQMGVQLWEELCQDSKTPESMLADLHALEQQRIALNMQISLVHSIGRQAAECAEKMAQADAVITKRLAQTASNPSKTPTQGA
ncbi:integrase [Pseudomonas oryzihabitans]|nr:integrase [Pseudomonas psychrotolerans]